MTSPHASLARSASLSDRLPSICHPSYSSKYIYDLYYTREAIDKPLYDWLLKEGYADASFVHSVNARRRVSSFRCVYSVADTDVCVGHSLIAKWKKPGYHKLCCVKCIQTKVRSCFRTNACSSRHFLIS